MMNTNMLIIGITCLVVAIGFSGSLVEAGQGCPFDDGSCQEYCNQQGCNMGYCGHFAWIQCICRKCGDEWSWYDKVRYNPDKTVNQTELDSLKLNATTTLILTTNEQQQQQQQPQQQLTKKVNSSKQADTIRQAATLTTLLIPDLSDTSGKLDLNDIPDENSDKFLDYLAKNHEKLVEATSAKQQQQHASVKAGEEEAEDQAAQGSPTAGPLSQDERDDEIIEIQISSSNNNTSNESAPTTSGPQQNPSTTPIPPPPPQTTTTTTLTAEQQQVAGADGAPKMAAPEASSRRATQQQRQSSVTRLLRMAVIERASDEID